MIRTLQNAPGAVTLFARTPLPALAALRRQLEAYRTPLASKPRLLVFSRMFGEHALHEEPRFVVDESVGAPTYDQFRTIAGFLDANKGNGRAFRAAFPTYRELKYVGDLHVPSEKEYEKVKAEFVGPLVVDWEHAVVANDEGGVDKVVEFYKGDKDV